jgi:hypothetical protein
MKGFSRCFAFILFIILTIYVSVYLPTSHHITSHHSAHKLTATACLQEMSPVEIQLPMMDAEMLRND